MPVVRRRRPACRLPSREHSGLGRSELLVASARRGRAVRRGSPDARRCRPRPASVRARRCRRRRACASHQPVARDRASAKSSGADASGNSRERLRPHELDPRDAEREERKHEEIPGEVADGAGEEQDEREQDERGIGPDPGTKRRREDATRRDRPASWPGQPGCDEEQDAADDEPPVRRAEELAEDVPGVARGVLGSASPKRVNRRRRRRPRSRPRSRPPRRPGT